MLAAAAVLGGVSYGVWYGLDQALGRSLAAQICSVGLAGLAGVAIYGALVWRIGIPETRLVAEVLRGRFRRKSGT
jgi:putative peptidoglycan lipid II flippase